VLICGVKLEKTKTKGGDDATLSIIFNMEKSKNLLLITIGCGISTVVLFFTNRDSIFPFLGIIVFIRLLFLTFKTYNKN
jgi:hypothetical protein